MNLTLILSTLFFWLGCAKNNNKEVCLTCKGKPPEVLSELKVMEQSFSIGIYKTTKYDNFTYSKVSNEIDQEANRIQRNQLESIVSSFDNAGIFASLITDRYLPVFYGVYIGKNIRIEKSIRKEDIKAISIVLYRDLGLHHFLFIKDAQGIVRLDTRLSVVTDAFYVSNDKMIFSKLLNDGSTHVSVMTMVTSAYGDVMNKIKTKDELSDKLKEIESAFPISAVSQKAIEPEECDPDICTPIQDTEGKCKALIGGMGCVETEDTPCPLRAISDAKNMLAEFSQMRNNFYKLRDSVLYSSLNGDIIISKYYIAGKYIRDNLSEIDLDRAYSYITLLNSKVSFLLANPQSSTILFDTTTKNDAIGLITELRDIDASTEWQQCLDWLQGLVNQFANQPTSQVFTYLHS
jgi:hypothetical protein